MMLTAGRFRDAIRLGQEALLSFDRLSNDVERHSTYAVLATCALESGETATAEEYFRAALSSGRAQGDVYAECAYALATIGDSTQAGQLLLAAEELEREGRSDVTGALMSSFAKAILDMHRAPRRVLEDLSSIPPAMPLDNGFDLERRMLLSLAHLQENRRGEAVETATAALEVAHVKGAVRVGARLELIVAMAERSSDRLRAALDASARSGALAPLVVADALAGHLDMLSENLAELRTVVAAHPARWLTPLRRQLNAGGTRNASAAARLLDEFGEAADVPLLRAYARTYRKLNRGGSSLGRSLARRVANKLEINDLGRTTLRVGDRDIDLGGVRRKSAALLMFLVTRPGHTASREQVLDELWPDADPDAATNNLNQSLYFLRREIDPWYEDDMSVDYLGLRADVVWLDAHLSIVASVSFANAVRAEMATTLNVDHALEIVDQYHGRFCPEFEYEEWASSWRTRVHALFLEYCNRVIDRAISHSAWNSARDIAIRALDRDPMAMEIERKLVWLYWRLGSQSAAIAQYSHLAAVERADGLDPIPLSEVVAAERP
jgi:DNA-binding SARP family transcriptional activator